MKDGVRITLLVDDEAGPGLAAEHGLAFWIEAGGRCILWDTGQGPALARNASALGIDLARADAIALSHGHYDHSGGLPLALAAAPAADLYVHAGAAARRYSLRDGRARPIHMPRGTRTALAAVAPDRLHWVAEPVMLFEGAGLTGPIPRELPTESAGESFFLDPEGTRPDPLDDDMALWIETPRGLVVCLGCCHAGLENTLAQISRSRAAPLRALLGGLHWLRADAEQLERGAHALAARAPELVAPCHCSGAAAGRALRAVLGDRVRAARAGSSFLF